MKTLLVRRHSRNALIGDRRHRDTQPEWPTEPMDTAGMHLLGVGTLLKVTLVLSECLNSACAGSFLVTLKCL